MILFIAILILLLVVAPRLLGSLIQILAWVLLLMVLVVVIGLVMA